jgi:hypothetical protein
MQVQPVPAFVPGPAETRSVAVQRAEFRFESDAALERALALVPEQSWIAICSVDRARRTLRVTLAPGIPQPPAPSRATEPATIH